VVTNRSMARMLGMHGEEMLARFAARDAHMPMCQLDALRSFFFDLGILSLSL
jgi:hypothetical protein